MKSTIKYFITEIKTDGKPIPETFNIFKYLSQLKELNITISTVLLQVSGTLASESLKPSSGVEFQRPPPPVPESRQHLNFRSLFELLA